MDIPIYNISRSTVYVYLKEKSLDHVKSRGRFRQALNNDLEVQLDYVQKCRQNFFYLTGPNQGCKLGQFLYRV